MLDDWKRQGQLIGLSFAELCLENGTGFPCDLKAHIDLSARRRIPITGDFFLSYPARTKIRRIERLSLYWRFEITVKLVRMYHNLPIREIGSQAPLEH